MERGLWGFVQGSETPPQPTASVEVRNAYRLRSDKAYSLIALSVDNSLQVHIASTVEPKTAWDILQNHFEFVSVTQIVRLNRKFYAASMKEGDDLMEHITHMTSLAEQLREMKEDISSKKFATIVLGSLPESYDNFITSLNARSADKFTWEDVKGLLVEEFIKRKEKKEKKEKQLSDDAMFAKRGAFSNVGRVNSRAGRGNSSFRGSYNNKGREQQQFNDRKDGRGPKCFKCNQFGHIVKNCPQNKRFAEKREHSNFTDYSNGKDSFEIEDMGLWIGANTNSNEWFIDSGATKHMTNNRSLLFDYQQYEYPVNIYLRDSSVVLAEGEGKVRLPTCDGSDDNFLALHNVLFVPNLTKNLLSVSAMAQMGAEICFDKEKCTVIKNGRNIVIGHMLNGKLFRVNTPEFLHLSTMSNPPALDLWHQRLGHLNHDYVHQLKRKDLVVGMKMDGNAPYENNCESCVLGKMHRQVFPKRDQHHTTKPMEIIHTDICGPMQIESLGGSRYILMFTDDYSRYTIVYFLKSKDETLSKFKEYVNLVENQTGCGEGRVKIVRSDNGGEYTSKGFASYSAEKGIVHQFTNPYCPEQNGISERLNRTIMESARSMIHHAKLPLHFWAEAVNTAVYLHNRSPTATLKDKTPFECWFDKKPDISNLRVFGCVCYMHVPNGERQKLDPKSRKGIFVGYPEGTKGYKLYDPIRKKFVKSRDVLFYERKFYYADAEGKLDDISKAIVFPSNSLQEVPVDMLPVGETTENDPVKATREDTFMQQVREIGAKRERKPPKRLIEEISTYAEQCLISESLVSESDEPKTVSEAWNGKNSDQWKQAMDSEYDSLVKNQTWELVPLPEGKKAIGTRWVYKLKRNADGSLDRFKARLVAKGYAQSKGVDYNEVFSPVARYSAIRSLLALANANDLEVHQMDVKTAFLNGSIDSEIYMTQPEGYVDVERPNHVCKLRKSIYGLKQSARCWYSTLDQYLISSGYRKSNADGCIYIKLSTNADGQLSFCDICCLC